MVLWEPRGGQRAENVELSFASCEFLDIKALGALVIIGRTLAGEGGRVTLIPPTNPRVRTFLATSGFAAAVAAGPDFRVDVDAPVELYPDARYERLFPLTWVGPQHDLKAFLKNVLQRHSSGEETSALPPGRATNLADIILGELVDNVAVHSGATSALVAAWNQADARHLDARDYLSAESSYVELHRDPIAAIHLLVADHGIGVAQTMAQEYDEPDVKLVERAFDRFSTSRPRPEARGTRGLYQVQRLARRQQGLVTLRSSHQYFVKLPFDDTGRVEEYHDPFPGTFLSVELPTHTPALIDSTLRRRNQSVPIEIRQIASAEPTQSALEDLFRMTPGHEERAQETLAIIDASQVSMSRNQAIDLVRRISAASHPRPTAIFGMALNNEQLGGIADDVNQELLFDELKQPGIVTDYEPILLVGSAIQHSFWTGTLPEVAVAMHEDVESSEKVNILRETSILRRNRDGTWQLRLSPGVVLESIREHLASSMHATLKRPKSGEYVTHALVHVDAYCDIFEYLVSHPLERTLASLLIAGVIERVAPAAFSPSICIIYESRLEEAFVGDLVARFRDDRHSPTLAVERVSPRDLETSRPLALPNGSEIVVLVSGIGSGQTARQLASLAMRQGHKVRAIAAVLDTRRNYGEPISLWERTFPVGAAVDIPLESVAIAHPELQYLDEAGRPESVMPSLSYSINFEDVCLSAGMLQALQLQHFSGPTDRHFTFFLEATPLFEPASLTVLRLLDEFSNDLANWMRGSSKAPLLTYATERRVDQPAARLAHELLRTWKARSFRSSFPRLRLVPNTRRRRLRGEEVVFVAWGSLSGASLVSTLSSFLRSGVRRLLVLVAFSQLDPAQERHFRELSRLSTGEGVLDLTIKFACYLPIEAFSQENCPVCSQSRNRASSLSSRSGRVEVERESRRLAVRSWQPADGTNLLDILAIQYGGSSSEIVGRALAIRGQLMSARWSTEDAYALKQSLVDDLTNEGQLLALATLFAYEPQWLQRSPIAHSDVRSAVANALADYLLPTQGAFRSSSELIRAALGLRLVSKAIFCAKLSDIMIAASIDDASFNFLCYLVEALLDRPYIKSTGLPVIVLNQLRLARPYIAASPTDMKVQGLDSLLHRAQTASSMSSLSDETRAHMRDHLRLKAKDFMEHDFDTLLKGALVKTTEADSLFGVASAWSRIGAWVQTELQPYVDELRDLLINTRALSHRGAFDLVFGDGRSATNAIHHTETMLRQAAELGRRLTSHEMTTANGLNDAIRDILYLTADSVRKRSRLAEAIDECSYSYQTLLDIFSEIAADKSVIVKVADRDAGFNERVVLMLPGAFMDQVFSTVVDNAVEYSIEHPRVVVKLQSFVSGGSALSFVSVNSQPKPRAQKPGGGGLDRLRRYELKGVQVTALETLAEGVPSFEVRIAMEDGT